MPDDVAFLIEQRGVVRPQYPVRETIAVADGVAEREAAGLPAFCSLRVKIQEAGMIVRHPVEAGGIDQGLA